MTILPGRIYPALAWIFGLFTVAVVVHWMQPTIVFVPNLKTGGVELLAQQPLHRDFRIPLVWAKDTRSGQTGWCYHDTSESRYILAFKSWDDPAFQEIAVGAENSLTWFWKPVPPPQRFSN
jgi:hypothetical protein